MSSEPPRTATQYCTFSLGGLHFGLDVEHVREVLKWQGVTPVPGSNRLIRGLLNLHGRIVPAIDLRMRLGLRGDALADLPMHLIARSGETTVSLLVDCVDDVIAPPASLWAPVPRNVHGPLRTASDGIYRIEDQMILIINIDKVLDLDGHFNAPVRKTSHPS